MGSEVVEGRRDAGGRRSHTKVIPVERVGAMNTHRTDCNFPISLLFIIVF